MTTLGVLITYYNEKELLAECLESLLNGTELPDEILIYDDCSTFPAQNYIPQHPLVRVIRGDTNQGVVVARNSLLQAAASAYLHFHDSDDLFHPTWTEQVRRALQQQPDLIVTAGDWLLADGSNMPYLAIHRHRDLLRADFRRFAIQHCFTTQCLTFRRELASEVGGYQTHDLRTSEDYFFGAVMALHAQTCEFVDKVLFRIRERPASLSRDEHNRTPARMYVQGVRALEHLIPLAADYRPVIMERLTTEAHSLLAMGNIDEARRGFRLAYRLGRPSFAYLGQPWRALARALGPIAAYRLFRLYAHPTLVRLRGGIRRMTATRAL